MASLIEQKARPETLKALRLVAPTARTLIAYAETYNEGLMRVDRTATEYSVNAPVLRRVLRGVDGQRTGEEEYALVSPLQVVGAKPTKGWKLVVNGVTCEVESVEIVQPGELPILYKLYLKADSRGATVFTLSPSALLLESGDRRLLESGDRLLLEDAA